MSTSGNIPIQAIKPIPHWMVLTLCWLFAILYGVWILPETVFIRHFCLVVGALLSLYVIYPNRRLLLKKEAAPIWLIGLLILWVTFHLFFIGRDFNAQWEEYTRIWKKIAVGSVFAIGLGIALISQSYNQKHTNQYWRIVYLGFLLPAIVYFIKQGVSALGYKFGFAIPVYLVLDPNHMSSQFGISRAWYVFFCLPSVAISIGFIAHTIKTKTFNLSNCLFYLFAIPVVLLIFYIENDRLGVFFGFALILVAIFTVGMRLLWRRNFFALVIFLALIICSAPFFWSSFRSNPEWQTLIADSRIAVQIDKFDNWKYNQRTMKGYPLNEFGKPVGGSNYLRVSWAVVGIRFVMSHPLGYGLLSLSLGRYGQELWPDSELSWSHSAWLDFTLGYGVPAFLLLFSAFLLSWKNSRKAPSPWFIIGRWALPMLSTVFLVKEISSEIFINAFVFMIVFSVALSLGRAKNFLNN